MNDLTQEKSEYNITYDPNAAYEFFKLFGKMESARQEEKLFVQGKKAGLLSFQSDKTYLLLEGSIAIETDSGSAIELNPGEIFGEFAAYTSRNASATAKLPSKLISLSEKQLLNGLSKKPEFLLMLMDVLVKFLGKADRGIHKASAPAEYKDNIKDGQNSGVLSSKMLGELKQKLGDAAVTSVPAKELVFQAGSFALLMYVILEGVMIISIGNKVIRRSGPGEIVGEIALLSNHARTANVRTETRCSLLTINRQTLMGLIPILPSFGVALLKVLASRLHIPSSVPDYNSADHEILVEEGEYKDSDWK